MLVLLSEFFTNEDPAKILFFFQLFEAKNSRKFLLLKFILTAIGIQSTVVSAAARFSSQIAQDCLL